MHHLLQDSFFRNKKKHFIDSDRKQLLAMKLFTMLVNFYSARVKGVKSAKLHSKTRPIIGCFITVYTVLQKLKMCIKHA